MSKHPKVIVYAEIREKFPGKSRFWMSITRFDHIEPIAPGIALHCPSIKLVQSDSIPYIMHGRVKIREANSQGFPEVEQFVKMDEGLTDNYSYLTINTNNITNFSCPLKLDNNQMAAINIPDQPIVPQLNQDRYDLIIARGQYVNVIVMHLI